jgi:hypothetical protein
MQLTSGPPRLLEKDVTPLGNLLEKLSNKPSKSLKSGQRISSHLPTIILILHGLLKMSSGSTVPDPDLELMNAENFDFAKPKLFFKNIGRYTDISTYIHVRIPFNFTTIFNTKQAISEVYDKLLDQHEEPFKSITKSVKDVSLTIIEGSLEDFRDIVKALPQKLEISMPGRPK